MEDTLTLIKDKESENSELDQRQDDDRDILLLVWGGLKGISEQFKDKEMPGTVSVTMNKAGVFADAFISVLSSLTRQCVIKGKNITETQTRLTEDFLDSLIYSVNQDIIGKRMGSLDILLAQHVSIRTGLGGKLNFGADGKPEYIHCDMRWLPFQEDGHGGYEWVANHTRRGSKSLKAEYSKWPDAMVDLIPEGKELDVYDFENAQVNEIWVGGKKIAEQENPFGTPRYVITSSGTGYYLADKGYLKYRHESIFGLNRNLYAEWHRLSSILQTMAIGLIKPPMAQEKANPEEGADAYPSVPGSLTAYGKGERPEAMMPPDLTQAFILALNNLSQALQQGGISDAELGDATIDRTAVWIASQETIRQRRMNPRIDAISQFYTRLSYLALKEFKMLNFGKVTPKFGKTGLAAEFSPDVLPDPDDINIEYRMMYDNPVLNIARRAEAVALKGILPDWDILNDVIQHKDPDGVMDRMRRQQAEQLDPVLFWFNSAHRLIDVADETAGEDKEQIYREAKVAADMMVDLIRKRNNPMPAPTSPATPAQLPKGNSQALLALPGIMGGKQ